MQATHPGRVWKRRPVAQSSSFLFILLSLTNMLAAQNSGQDVVGIVVERIGTWTDATTGNPLNVRDAIVSATKPNSEHSERNMIKIALFDGRTWEKRCTSDDPCRPGGYPLPEIEPGRPSLLSFIKSYFSTKENISPIFTAARGVESNGPKEAVLSVDDGVANLSAVLDGIPAGRLKVTLKDVSKLREPGISRIVNWPQESQVVVGDVSLSIFSVSIQIENGDPLGSAAAVLLVGAAIAPAAQAEFKKAKELSEKWQDVDPAMINTFLVQSLYAIQSAMRQ
jgi:hypothetical protein